MMGSIDRQFVSQFIIMLAVCIGAWMMLVEPRVGELHELEATLAAAERDAALLNEQAIELMANRMQTVRSRLGAIEARNAFGRDSMLRFRRIMELAEKHQVKVSRLDPGAISAKEKAKGAAVEVVAFNASVEGAYEHVADFLSELNELDGFIRPVSLSMYPRVTEEGPVIEARFNSEAMSFAIPEALLVMKGDQGS